MNKLEIDSNDEQLKKLFDTNDYYNTFVEDGSNIPNQIPVKTSYTVDFDQFMFCLMISCEVSCMMLNLHIMIMRSVLQKQ